MKSKRGYLIILILFIVLVIIVSGYIQQENFGSERPIENTNQAGTIIAESLQNGGLGTLCMDKEDCISFCLNNRGMCEEYCNENTNELCLTLFSSTDVIPDSPEVDCVSNQNPVFSEPIVDYDRIDMISTMVGPRFSNPGGAARTYITMKQESSGAEIVPVYAPVDSTLTKIAYANRNLGSQGIRPEYRLDFQVSCEVTYTFDHLAAVATNIEEYAPKNPADKTNEPAFVSLPIRAGELVGYTDRNIIRGNWDFMVQNTAVKKTFINPTRWLSEHSLYGDCPYDYFSDGLKNKYYLLLLETLSGQPRCGSTILEKAGTLAGAWFQDDADENQGPRMSVTSNVHLTDVEILRDSQERFDLRDTNSGRINSEDVRIGERVCYYDLDRNVFAFFKLVSETEIELATGTGVCPSNSPGVYEVWVR